MEVIPTGKKYIFTDEEHLAAYTIIKNGGRKIDISRHFGIPYHVAHRLLMAAIKRYGPLHLEEEG